MFFSGLHKKFGGGAGVPQAVEYDFLGVHIRIIHFSQDFLKPLIQVFRHNGTSIGLTDGKVLRLSSIHPWHRPAVWSSGTS